MRYSIRCAVLVLLFVVTAAFAARGDRADDIDVPLKNWAVPSATPLRIGSTAASSSNASFIAIEPWRAVATRYHNAGAPGGGLSPDNSPRPFGRQLATGKCDALDSRTWSDLLDARRKRSDNRSDPGQRGDSAKDRHRTSRQERQRLNRWRHDSGGIEHQRQCCRQQCDCEYLGI